MALIESLRLLLVLGDCLDEPDGHGEVELLQTEFSHRTAAQPAQQVVFKRLEQGLYSFWLVMGVGHL